MHGTEQYWVESRVSLFGYVQHAFDLGTQGGYAPDGPAALAAVAQVLPQDY
jgi:hypothetical protein